jgi:hypothetical protein
MDTIQHTVKERYQILEFVPPPGNRNSFFHISRIYERFYSFGKSMDRGECTGRKERSNKETDTQEGEGEKCESPEEQREGVSSNLRGSSYLKKQFAGERDSPRYQLVRMGGSCKYNKRFYILGNSFPLFGEKLFPPFWAYQEESLVFRTRETKEKRSSF